MVGCRTLGSIALVMAALLPLGGCAEKEKEVVAPVFGAGVGLAAGSAIGSTAAEAGLGAAGFVVGLAVAPYLGKRDVAYFDQAIEQAAARPLGESVRWRNPNTGTTGEIKVIGEEKLFAAKQCRKLRSSVTTENEMSFEEMVVCRDNAQPWYIHSSEFMDRRPIDKPQRAAGKTK
jgi:surface antigen